MRRSVLCILACIVLVGTLVRAMPLFSYALWGSDSGEYYYLTDHLASTGTALRDGYEGWGEVYPYFPGFLVVAGALSSVSGMGVLQSLMLAPLLFFPVSLVAIFLIGRRIFGNDAGGLLGAAFLAIVMPHVYPTSHAMPGSLGDALMILALLSVIASAKDNRFWVVLAPLSLALIVTHHLSSYLFLIAVMGGIAVRELFVARGARDARRVWRECAFVAAFYVGMVIFWLELSPGFERRVLSSALPMMPPEAIAFAGFVLIAALPFLVLRFPKIPSLGRSAPGGREVAVRIAAIAVALLAVLAIASTLGIPATTMKVPLVSILFFFPLIAIIVPVIVGSRALDLHDEGNTVFGWFAGIAASGLLGVATGSIALSPYRHVEYLMMPFALLFAAGILLVLVFIKGRTRRIAFSAGVATLVLINIPLAYPPQDVMVGFEEGTYQQEWSCLLWAGENTPARSVFASDHRMSSALFGFEGKYATWDTTPRTFTSANFSPEVKAELASANAPLTPRQVQYVLLTDVMKRGIALDPNAPAVPITDASLLKFEQGPFVTLYDNGFAKVVMIDWSMA